ncbi:MAG TPA: hypothetical protein VGE04_09410 [Chloroflexia bacterium]|jgi:hypothetical protein
MSFLSNFRHNLHQKTRQTQHGDVDTPTPTEGQGAIAPGARADLDAVAEVIARAGLSVPAALALEVGKPLAWLGGQVLWVLQPFADAIGVGARKGPLSIEGVARMLEREGSTEALVERLEAGAESRKKGGPR